MSLEWERDRIELIHKTLGSLATDYAANVTRLKTSLESVTRDKDRSESALAVTSTINKNLRETITALESQIKELKTRIPMEPI